MANKRGNIISDIKAYFKIKRNAEKGKKFQRSPFLEADRHHFITTIADLFNSKDVRELLNVTKGEVSLFAYYSSSMGAAMTGGLPDYEIVVSSEGLMIKKYGRVSVQFFLPATLEVWERIILYGGLFYDSRSGDHVFSPPVGGYIKRIENKLRQLMKN